MPQDTHSHAPELPITQRISMNDDLGAGGIKFPVRIAVLAESGHLRPHYPQQQVSLAFIATQKNTLNQKRTPSKN